MDDEAIFGPVLHRLSFRDAIERGLLSDYRVVVIGVDNPDIQQAVDHRELVARGSVTVDAETLGRQVGLIRTIERFDLKRILTFHSRRATARAFAESLPEVLAWMPEDARPHGQLWARHITGDMSAGERERLLDKLRELDDADWGVLSNVRCVAEGIDVPTLDGVAFVDPRRSQIDIIQAVGRAIRKSADKRLGIIVIPVFMTSGWDDEHALEDSDFQKVWAVVRALRAHDDVLAEQLDAARFELGKRGSPLEVPEKIILDLPRSISPDFARAFSARIVNRSSSSFEFWLGLLTRYAEEHGTVAGVNKDEVVAGQTVGAWINSMRARFSRGEVPAERAARLEAVPGWTWRPREANWERMFNLLEEYVARTGTARMHRDHVEHGEALGVWVRRQPWAYKGIGGWGKLSEEQVARLEALPGWAWDRQAEKWDKGLAALGAFAKREGHIDVPDGHREDGINLRSWVSRVRHDHTTGRLVRMSPERIARLEVIPGWRWRETMDARWERHFSALATYADREGHVRVPPSHVENGTRLGAWIARQMEDFRSGRLGAKRDRVERLQSLPGWRWNNADLPESSD